MFFVLCGFCGNFGVMFFQNGGLTGGVVVMISVMCGILSPSQVKSLERWGDTSMGMKNHGFFH